MSSNPFSPPNWPSGFPSPTSPIGKSKATSGVSCSACYGVLYMSRPLWSQGKAARCFGVRRTFDRASGRAEWAKAFRVSDPMPEEEVEEVTHLVFVGKSIEPEMPFDPLNPITMPVCVAGVRVLAAINSDEEETTSKEAPSSENMDWTPSILAHLQKQSNMVNTVYQRMRWQISEQGRQDLVSRLTSFLPIYTNFARSYAAKISEYFNDSHDENP